MTTTFSVMYSGIVFRRPLLDTGRASASPALTFRPRHAVNWKTENVVAACNQLIGVAPEPAQATSAANRLEYSVTLPGMTPLTSLEPSTWSIAAAAILIVGSRPSACG